MKKRIFVISGLGADHTVFGQLSLPGYELVHVQWVETKKGESLAEYATRLLPQITEKNPIVMGLSLGGMLALEVSKQIPTEKVISLSSATCYRELPFRYKVARVLRLHKILPVHWFAKGNRFTNWLFGAKKQHDKEILKGVFDRLDQKFLYWALNAVLNWKNTHLPANMYRIHGTADLILPADHKARYDHLISGGTHLMLMDQPEEVADAIRAVLQGH